MVAIAVARNMKEFRVKEKLNSYVVDVDLLVKYPDDQCHGYLTTGTCLAVAKNQSRLEMELASTE